MQADMHFVSLGLTYHFGQEKTYCAEGISSSVLLLKAKEKESPPLLRVMKRQKAVRKIDV